ncbi:MAG: PKD domain-containing protein [Candidatus Phocaeicola faecipullorum]|nr:PKD domain-containing protein [Candidatus Phocaeicola faecipullorum]
MKKLFKYFVFALAVSLTACSTEDPTDNNGGNNTENPDGNNNDGDKDKKITADFDFTVNKTTGDVAFTNKSTGADAYEWAFGDEQDGFSTEKDPVYRYSKSGKYKVTLVASKGTDYDEISKEVDITIEKKEVAIKIDGSFDDWKNIPLRTDVELEGFTELKTVATNNYIYIYLAAPKNILEGAGFVNFAADLDYNYETGQREDQFPGGKTGCDVCREIDGSFVWGVKSGNTIGWDWQQNKELVTLGDATINDMTYKEWRMDLKMAEDFIKTNKAHGIEGLDQIFAKASELNKEKARVYAWLRKNDWSYAGAAPKRGNAPFDVKLGEYINTEE